MMILINAFKSITRSKGRNILVGIIILTIAISCSIALAIKNAAETAKESGLANQTITGSISVDREKLMENSQSSGTGQPDMDSMRELMGQYTSLSLSEMQSYADSEYVKDFYYTASASLNATGDIEAYSTSSSNTSGGETSDFPGGMQGGMTMGDFTVTGYSSESAMTNFISGESQITEGEMFDVNSSDLNCLISSELAAYNGLSVNDTITLSNPNAEGETYTFTITGIYTNESSSSQDMMFSTAQDPANLIVVSYSALETISTNSQSVATTSTDDNGYETSTAISLQTSGTYVFSDLTSYENFQEELSNKGLSEYYKLSSSDISSYEASLVPLENLSNFATTMLLIVLIVGGVILIVLNIFNIRERKYEVGVLTAIGIKKSKVALQYVSELLIITIIAVLIGTGIGAMASTPVSNSLLATQIESQEVEQNNLQQNFGRPGIEEGGSMPSGGMFGETSTTTEYVDTIDATISMDVLGQLAGISILLTFISSLAGIVFVLRYDPLKILANRS